MVLRRIGVLSTAKMMGAIYGVLGLVFAIMFVPFLFLAALLGPASGRPEDAIAGLASGIFGLVFAIIMPVLYAVMGFVFGALSAWLYNVLQERIGGIEIELSER